MGWRRLDEGDSDGEENESKDGQKRARGVNDGGGG